MSGHSWREDAACLGRAPLFDATINDSGRWDGESTADRAARFAAAIAVCRTCPVSAQCAAEARVGRDEGVRAGVLLPNLDQVRSRDGEPLKITGRCGSPYGAKAHRERGEAACDACAEARRAYDRDYQQRRRKGA